MEVTISTYELMKKFPDQHSAREYLENQRWEGKPVCPYCQCQDQIRKRTTVGYYRCLSCKKDFTVRTGTVMERSHIPLNKWILAMYLMVTARKGVSSLQLSKEIGITQKSAWFMLQRLREACEDRKILKGIVEADECYIGGKEANKHEHKKLKSGRGTVGKTPVLGMRERKGRVTAETLKGVDTKTMQKAIRKNVSPGAVLCTDEHSSYQGMPEFEHLEVNHSAKEFVNGMAHTNGIESVWAVLKRGYNGVYHNFSTKHLQRYLNEFTFRLNDGNCRVETLDRINALFQGAIGKTLTYSRLKESKGATKRV